MAIKKTEYIKFGENLYEIIPPLPSGTDRGGIIASPKESIDTVEIKLGEDGKLYAPAYPDLSSIDTIQTQINEWTNRKRDLINSLAQSKRELRRAQEEIMIIEARTKEFIPIPEIVLPTSKAAMGEPIYDLFSILTQKDGKYILEQKEEEVIAHE
jgi:hypothetical protein